MVRWTDSQGAWGYLGLTEALEGYEQAVNEFGVAVGQCKAKERSCSHPWKPQLQNAWEVARVLHRQPPLIHKGLNTQWGTKQLPYRKCQLEGDRLVVAVAMPLQS